MWVNTKTEKEEERRAGAQSQHEVLTAVEGHSIRFSITQRLALALELALVYRPLVFVPV